MRCAGQGRQTDPGFEVETAGAVTQKFCSIGWVRREAMMKAAMASAMAATGGSDCGSEGPRTVARGAKRSGRESRDCTARAAADLGDVTRTKAWAGSLAPRSVSAVRAPRACLLVRRLAAAIGPLPYAIERPSELQPTNDNNDDDSGRRQRLRRRSPMTAVTYFFSGSGFVCGTPGALPALTAPPGVNGNVANIDFAWFCICSCICTNMFFDCSI